MRFVRSFALLSICAMSAAAKADTINVFGTGITSTGATASAGSVDSHYVLYAPYANNTNGYVQPNAIVTTPNAAYYQPTTGHWLTPAGDARNGTALGEQPAGLYMYTTTFTLGHSDVLSTALLNLNLAADDSVKVYLNYVDNAHQVASYDAPAYPSLSGTYMVNDASNLFQTGLNTLYFEVDNGGGPTGLYVQASGSVTSTPEPSSLMLLGTGVFGVAGMARRKFLRA